MSITNTYYTYFLLARLLFFIYAHFPETIINTV